MGVRVCYLRGYLSVEKPAWLAITILGKSNHQI